MKSRRHTYSDDLLIFNRPIKRAKSSENGGENVLPIPIDLVFEIFSRLPVKSIARCRCVSKIWASMLRRREFTDLFSSKCYAHPQLLFAYVMGNELVVFSSPQPQNPDENSPPVIANYQISFSFDGPFRISGCVNGLVCVIKDKRLTNGRKETIPVICKPNTGESLALKKVKTSRGSVRSMIGYDPIDKGFKILSMTKGRSGVEEEHQVLTLGTDKWRMLDCCKPGQQYCYTEKGLCISGIIYYQSMDLNEICCFDIRSEKFSFIDFHGIFPFPTLINYGGNLGLLWSEKADCCFDPSFDKTSTNLRLWILEDVERQEWSKHIIVLPHMWKYVVGENRLRVVGVTSTNEIVFESPFRYHHLYLYYLNTDKNTIVKVEIQGISSYIYDGIRIFMNHIEDVKLF